eukprot:7388086-Prymnesium_polylepis.1
MALQATGGFPPRSPAASAPSPSIAGEDGARRAPLPRSLSARLFRLRGSGAERRRWSFSFGRRTPQRSTDDVTPLSPTAVGSSEASAHG